MGPDRNADDDRSHRLDAAMAEYYVAMDTGRPLDPADWLARHPDLAADLAVFVDDIERIGRIIAPSGREGPEATWTTREAGNGVDETELRRSGPPDDERLRDEVATGTFIRYLGDFKLLKVLGRGGMGVVYKARQVSLDRLVALKMIRDEHLAGEDEIRRFRNEAEAIARLNHPNLLTIYEVGEHEGHHYFTMPLIHGGSLDDHPELYRCDPRLAARLVATIADAIHHAHQRGIIHRDLKPANVLIDETGRPFVADFGLAKRIDEDGSASISGGVVGSPAYMAPEQTGGDRKSVTTASDVYGLGAILYTLLAGRQPFRGGPLADLLRRVREEEPERPSRRNPPVGRDLDSICLKCLAKDAHRRYASAAALAEDLRRWTRGEPIEARPIGPAARLALWCRRRPAVAGLGAALALSIALGFAGMAWLTYVARQSAAAAGLSEIESGKSSRKAEIQAIAAKNSEIRSAASERKALELARERADLLGKSRRREAELALDKGNSIAERGQVGRGLHWIGTALRVAPAEAGEIRDASRRAFAAWSGRTPVLRADPPR